MNEHKRDTRALEEAVFFIGIDWAAIEHAGWAQGRDDRRAAWSTIAHSAAEFVR